MDKIRLFKNNGHVFRSLHLQHFEMLVKYVKSKNSNGIFIQNF